jgi:hypothetical protein
MKTNLKTLGSLLLLISSSLIISSCGSDPNLAKVREFSKNANEAKENLPKIAADFYESCLRSARYKAVNILPPESTGNVSTVAEKDVILEQIKALEDRLRQEPNNSSLVAEIQKLNQKLQQLPPSSDRLQERIDAQKRCNEKSQFASSTEPQIPTRYLGELMETGNIVIVSYMEKLGEVAGEDINFDNEFASLKSNANNLTNKLTDIFKISGSDRIQERVGAGVDIANFILTQIFEGKRRNTLKEVIPATNEPLQLYAKGLQTVVQRVYIDQSLREEERALDLYYIDYINEILDSKERQEGNSTVTIANTLISLDKDRWNPEKDRIQERREAAYAYIKLLQTIIDSHQELATIYRDGKEPSKQTLKQIMNSNNQALKNLVEKTKVFDRDR